MYECKHVDERFVDVAAARGAAEREMAVSAGQLFTVLEDGPSWSKWVPVIRHAEWTSPKPFTQGTMRTVKLMGGIRVDSVSTVPARRGEETRGRSEFRAMTSCRARSRLGSVRSSGEKLW